MRPEEFHGDGLMGPKLVERLPWPRAARFILGATALVWMIILLIVQSAI